MNKWLNLEEIAQRYNSVVFDTSILDASTADKQKRREYSDEVIRILGSYANILTIKEVYNEANVHFSKVFRSKLILQRIKHRRFDISGLNENYNNIIGYLGSQLSKLKNKEPEKNHSTDLKLAAFALTLATFSPKTAFLSGDKNLNYFVEEMLKRSKKEKQSDFGCNLNVVDIYQFKLRHGTFIQF